ncbi:MAG: glycoside hydrolase family 3 C-terminal domain-containing protein [Acidobacteriota bacterium]|nr:glycoside hydrolase family 3 C-terminal domain-containing protein [Acidobacteriota bacterium]
MKGIRLLCPALLAVVFWVCVPGYAQSPESNKPPYLDPSLPVDVRVKDLVGRMTLQEKISQTLNNAPAIERLQVPAYDWWNEALHGVARAGVATVFPQAIGLAAMWDEPHLFTVATAISDEARAKHHEFVRQGQRGRYQGLTFWSPNINIFRDPRWGRGMETFGEDPYLTGRLGIAFIKGLQGEDPKYFKVIATSKHFAVHSGPEPARHVFDAQASDRDLYETYLPHFRASVAEGKVYSFMGAYNRFRGESASAHKFLLEDLLRGRWGFDGYVVSDCGAIRDIYANHKIVATEAEAAALGIRRGCDLNCGSAYKGLADAIQQGLLTEKELDVSVQRLFTARMRLGMFDPPEMVKWAQIPYSVNDSPQNARLAEDTARKSMVLLKNKNNTLPLSKKLRTIAVIGPNADDVETLLGNYNGTPSNPITPLAGIRAKVGSSAKVLYARGSDIAQGMASFESVPDAALKTSPDGSGKSGVTVEFFNNLNFEGKSVRTERMPNIKAAWGNDAPYPELADDTFSVRFSGWITVPETGEYSLRANGAFGRLLLDGKPLGAKRGAPPEFLRLEAGKPYAITVEAADRFGGMNIELQWSLRGRDLAAEAVAAAKAADVAILFLGLSPRLEGEEMPVQIEGFSGGDRVSIDLPKIQEDLMRAVVATGTPTVLVLLNGSALAVNWADENIPAILEAWYPGQAAGTAIADVLFGDYNPAGRLPVTFYRSLDGMLPFEDYSMKGRTYKYFSGKPLYPFGHGLSYTTFAYKNLQLPKKVEAGKPVPVTVTVTNTGKRAGDEVVQLYLTDREASVPVPIRKLVGFRRIHLKAGASETVSFTIDPREMSLITDDTRRVIEPGVFDISIGGKQPGFSGTADAPTTGVVTGQFTATGNAVELDL